jgi:hypothetical protein
MKYDKPDVVSMGQAVDMIATHTMKGQTLPFDREPSLTTSAAYEADE